ncbi:TPA: hypothetical protein RVR74_003285 [Aeromonas salmonicida]|nr:hypothetical protein [Aeromonas salmonicida]
MNATLILFVFVILLMICIGLYKKSPLLILPLIYLSVGLYTILGERFFEFSIKVPFDFHDEISVASVTYIYWCLIAASVFYTLGFLLFFKNSGGHSNAYLQFNYMREKNISDKNIVTLFLSTIFLLHIGYGFTSIYYREGYTLGDSGIGSARVLYTLLLPLTCLLIPFSNNRWLKLFLGVSLFLLVMGTSSRNLVLIPACIFLGSVIKTGTVSVLRGLFFGVLVSISVTISLQSRNYQIQGVIPNIISLFESGLDFSLMNYSINYLTSFSIFASALTQEGYSSDILSLYYSLTPLPSSAINIDYMVESQKLNDYSPFPALGLLALNGPLFLCLYYFISGAIISSFGGYLARKNKSLNLFVVMLVLVFSFLSLQYNLRGTTRILYYLIFFSLVVRIFYIIIYNIKLCRHSSE